MSVTWGRCDRTARRWPVLAAALAYALACGPAGYWDTNCAQYVSHVAGIPARTAAKFYSGEGLRLTGSFARFENLPPLHEGDIVAFNGSHVAVFTDGRLMDSDPAHGGPGPLRYVRGDSWFAGPIRVYKGVQ